MEFIFSVAFASREPLFGRLEPVYPGERSCYPTGVCIRTDPDLEGLISSYGPPSQQSARANHLSSTSTCLTCFRLFSQIVSPTFFPTKSSGKCFSISVKLAPRLRYNTYTRPCVRAYVSVYTWPPRPCNRFMGDNSASVRDPVTSKKENNHFQLCRKNYGGRYPGPHLLTEGGGLRIRSE